MGQEIQSHHFTEDHRQEFMKRVRQETKYLMTLFQQRKFDHREQAQIGLEVEAWLVNENHLPHPLNDEFLKAADHPLLVHELSQFNFEMNVDPCCIAGQPLKSMRDQLDQIWEHCQKTAKSVESRPMLIGILPMIRNEMLQLEYMSRSQRYRALNDQLMAMRDNVPLNINIDGRDRLQIQLESLMLEAAATSIQVHLQVNQEDSVRYINASKITSAPLVAVSANSPFLYGKSLWDETRIPVFEQAVKVASFRNKHGQDVGRVTFGTGYAQHSLLEYFLENLDGYPSLLPELMDTPVEKMSHLKLQNGTVWRWNRPIVGSDSQGNPHLRIEQRVMAAGPSVDDIVANMAFYLGLVYYYGDLEKAPEESMTFTDCTNNFYAAAKNGLGAKLRWFGKEVDVQSLILDQLLDQAKQGLKSAGVDVGEIEHYLGDVMYHRVLTGKNGAHWQRSFADFYGFDMQALSERYLELQNSGKPVHSWEL